MRRSQLIANQKWQNHTASINIYQHLSASINTYQHLKLPWAGLGRVRGSPEFDLAAVESSVRKRDPRSPTLSVFFNEQTTLAKVQRVQRIRHGNCGKKMSEVYFSSEFQGWIAIE